MPCFSMLVLSLLKFPSESSFKSPCSCVRSARLMLTAASQRTFIVGLLIFHILSGLQLASREAGLTSFQPDHFKARQVAELFFFVLPSFSYFLLVPVLSGPRKAAKFVPPTVVSNNALATGSGLEVHATPTCFRYGKSQRIRVIIVGGSGVIHDNLAPGSRPPL